ncbi:MAG TPA: Type 1 glutamine amidotransferase-like domain-containing protein [Actinomycetota bacterium]
MSGARRLGLLGSGEFEPWAEEVDRWLLDGASDGRVLVAPAASAAEGEEVFSRWGRRGVAHYERLGYAAEVLPLKTRDDAADPRLASRLDEASMVFFSGGNPADLAATLAGTFFWDRLLQRLGEGLAFGGCSAGVAFLGELAPDSSIADPPGGDPWRPGLSAFGGVVLAPHWDTVDAHVPGFRTAVERMVGPGLVLVGVDERTALIGDGRTWRVTGEGSVHVRFQDAWTSYPPGRTLPSGVLGLTSAARPA